MTVLRRPELFQEGLKNSGVRVKGMGSQVVVSFLSVNGKGSAGVGEHLAGWLVSQLAF